jgi:hypothetical protein
MVFKQRLYSNILLFIFISTTYIIKLSIYLCSKFFFLSFRTTFCFTNPDYRLIRMAPQLLLISRSLLYYCYFYQ